MFEKNKSAIWAWMLGVALIVAAVGIALTRKPPRGNAGFATSQFAQTGDGVDLAVADSKNGSSGAVPIESRNSPMVLNFVGDLTTDGMPQNDGTLVPYVIGECLKLEAEAINAIEWRWTANGEVIKDDGQEWSRRKDREFEVKAAGDLRVSVQVRGSDAKSVSQPRDVTLHIKPVYIVDFDKALVHDDDRCLTGDEFTVEVTLADPMTADLDTYELRYFINDVPIKHPEDDQEWTNERDLTYTFKSPGQYSFKVEVRRKGQTEAEDSRALAETIVVADAIILSFDANPDKYAPLGTSVGLDAFPQSSFGRSEMRFGVKKVVETAFEWLPDEDGSLWGESERAWLPTEPGNYIVRAEVREAGHTSADDYREVLYTITEGTF